MGFVTALVVTFFVWLVGLFAPALGGLALFAGPLAGWFGYFVVALVNGKDMDPARFFGTVATAAVFWTLLAGFFSAVQPYWVAVFAVAYLAPCFVAWMDSFRPAA